MKDDWRQNLKNLTPGATKNSLNATERIIKKGFLEPKLLNFSNVVTLFLLNFLPILTSS